MTYLMARIIVRFLIGGAVGTLDDRGSDRIVRLRLFRQENEEGQILRCMSRRADFILI
jgi:hypothetical protein